MKPEEQLPDGWAWANFANLVESVSTVGRKLAQAEYQSTGRYPVIDQGQDFVGGYTDDSALVVKFSGKPFLVFGDHTRAFKFVSFDFVPGADGIKVYISHCGDPKWLFYAGQALPLPNKGYARHAQYLHASNMPIPPLLEQRRIVAKIEELFTKLDAGVAALNRAKALLKQYRQAVLKAAVTGELTHAWRKAHLAELEPADQLLKRILAERRKRWETDELAKLKAKGKAPKDDRWKAKYKEPELPKTEGLPELPEAWCWATVDQLSSLVTSGSRGWKEYYSARGATFIRAQDIRTDKLELADVAHVTPPLNSEGTRTRVSQGDLLVTITGANVAKTALVEVNLPEAYVSQHVALVRFVPPVLGLLIHTYVAAEMGGRKILLKSAYGAGKPGLNLDNIRKLQIPLPPLQEQEILVSVISNSIENVGILEEEVEKTLNTPKILRQSILRSAFSGQLVTQCSADEPASVLLERIKADRAATGNRANAREPSDG